MPWGVAAAVVGWGISANSASKSSKKQAQSASDALSLQREQFNTVRQDTAAQREIGTGAINKLADILGIERSFAQAAPTREQFTTYTSGSNAGKVVNKIDPVDEAVRNTVKGIFGKKNKQQQPSTSFDQAGFDAAMEKYNKDLEAFNNRAKGLDAFTPDPGYQFRLDNTNKTIDRYQSAGRVTGGRAIKEATRYGQDFASNEFGNATNRLFTLAGFGPAATNTSASAGANAANNMSNITLRAGDNEAAKYANINNSVQSGLGNLTTYKTYNDWQHRLSPTSSSQSSFTYDSPTFGRMS